MVNQKIAGDKEMLFALTGFVWQVTRIQQKSGKSDGRKSELVFGETLQVKFRVGTGMWSRSITYSFCHSQHSNECLISSDTSPSRLKSVLSS